MYYLFIFFRLMYREIYKPEIMKNFENITLNYRFFDKLDRSVLFITHKKSFYVWLDLVAPDECKDHDLQAIAFLAPLFFTGKDEENYLTQNFDQFFQNELEYWCPDPTFWPVNRTYQLFCEWFDVTIAANVYDTLDISWQDYDKEFDIFNEGIYFNDTGNPVDPFLLSKPGLCLVCRKGEDPDPGEEILCDLNRLDQINNDNFRCKSYIPWK